MEESETRRRYSATSFLCGRTGLLILMTGYALLGAVLFKTIEGDVETYIPTNVHKNRDDCLKELWLITGKSK